MTKHLRLALATALSCSALAGPASASLTFNWQFADQSHPGEIVTGTISGLNEGYNSGDDVTVTVTNALFNSYEGGGWISIYNDDPRWGYTVANGAITFANTWYYRGSVQYLYFGSSPNTIPSTYSPSLQGSLGSQFNQTQPDIFTPVATAAVPEPATWAMLVGGFGLVGGAMRRRARATVRFA